MKSNQLDVYRFFRSALAIRRDFAYLLACDSETEEQYPYTKIVVINGDARQDSYVKFNAYDICRVVFPESGVLVVDSEGRYAYFAKKVHAGNIIAESCIDDLGSRYGSFRCLASIEGVPYAAGSDGMVYKFAGVSNWRRCDKGLVAEMSVQSICGRSSAEIYAVGLQGFVFKFDGSIWSNFHSPTNVNLTCALVSHDGVLFIGGHRGVLFRWSDGFWSEISGVIEDIWSLAEFKGEIYFSSFSGVYKIEGDRASPVRMKEVGSVSTYRLSSCEDVLLSIGEFNLVAFDGVVWRAIY